MKKLISLMMAVALVLSLGTLLIACDETHEHAFDATWTYDETTHWHVCTGDTCTEAADRAEHTFTDPVVVTEATLDAEGTTKQTCTVCGYEKGGKVAFAGVSENKWEAMLAASNFDNFTLTQTGDMTTTADGEEFETSETSTFKIAGDKGELVMYFDGQEDRTVFDGEIAEAQKLQYTQLFMCLLREYENFVYDAEQKVYAVNKTITIEETFKAIVVSSDSDITMSDLPTTIVMRNAKAKISNDGKLLELVCDYTQSMEIQGRPVSVSGVTTWTFSNYGTTVIEDQ